MILTLVIYPSNLKELVNVLVEKVERLRKLRLPRATKEPTALGFVARGSLNPLNFLNLLNL
ncbi:hypothetical protein Halhy_2120 [Haliscomenobacter hydrossis DSM 1100]|uniref:Uncharacterized protein n=1 Tax=Haliscomenobacter hydrossis (strain ATCC 27775 / DSM 1100 / LMG 10767 / O) TaxID=760192 RepID=F4KQL6_HALH1|nr:hypothetical protein Halhy_2120 [Haliscomenobacter hydrossis DSM 1100]